MQRHMVFALAVLLLAAATAASGEEVVEAWRSPFGYAHSVSVNHSDGSCWVACASGIWHVAADGTILSQTTGLCQTSDLYGFRPDTSISVNSADGSCWMADYHGHEVVHLSAEGEVLWRGGRFYYPADISVNPTDGSCWVADHYNIVHLAEDGTELFCVEGFSFTLSLCVNPTDGSCWVTDAPRDRVVHLAEDGTELLRVGGCDYATFVAVNATDSSVWVSGGMGGDSPVWTAHLAEDGTELWRTTEFGCRLSVNSADGSCWLGRGGSIVHMAADGEILSQHGGFGFPLSVSVNPTNGSCWAGDGHQIVHLAADGTDLWRGEGFNSPGSLSVNSIDGSCWVADSYANDVVHLAQNGTVLSRSAAFESFWGAAMSLSVNPTDGSCWAADEVSDEVIHLSAAGEELWRGDVYSPRAISVNPVDGSCWVPHWSDVVHLAEDGTELLRVGGFEQVWGVCVNPTDGSCWVTDFYQGVVHLAEDGTELLRVGDLLQARAVWVNPTDGSCWVEGWWGYRVVHLAEDGTELWRSVDLHRPVALSVNPADGSCWVVEEVLNGRVVHVAEDGTELWRGDGFGTTSRGGISVNPTDGSCWVVDGAHSQVVHLVIPGWRAPVFYDVAWHHWAFDQVEACCNAGIVAGYEDGLYYPELAVTRDQMAVYLARALEAPSGEAVLADWVPADPQDFPDVPADHWAYTHVEYCVENGVVTGHEDGLYHPEYEVTRDQMAVYVARALVAPEGEAALADYVPASPRDFPDVPSDFWAYTHVEYCVENGVVTGYEDGYYHPEYLVTRDQMAVYVARAFGLVS